MRIYLAPDVSSVKVEKLWLMHILYKDSKLSFIVAQIYLTKSYSLVT